MEHSYIKHLHDHENKNVMSIHRFENISVIVLGRFVNTTFYLTLFFYYSLPLRPQTFRSLHLHHFGRSLSSANKCVDNRTW